MPTRPINVETLREELTKFRVDFAVQEADSINVAVRTAIRQELQNFFESSGGDQLKSDISHASMLSFAPQATAQSAVFRMHDAVPAGPQESIITEMNPDIGWARRHRKSYMLFKEEDGDQFEIGRGRRRSMLRASIEADHAGLGMVEEQASAPSSRRGSQSGSTPALTFLARESSGTYLARESGPGKRQDYLAPLSASTSHSDLEALAQEAQPVWARHHRKAKRMSTVRDDGFEISGNTNDARRGPYNITCGGAVSREKNSFSPLAPTFSPTGSESDQKDSAFRTAWLTVFAPIRSTVLNGYRLDSCIVVFIILNAISVGVQTDMMARNWTAKTPFIFRVLNLIFCAVFTVEILLKLCVHGSKFFQTAAWRWNIFDTVVVSGQIVEEVSLLVADVFQPNNGGHVRKGVWFMCFSVVRTLRVFRLIRVMRIVSIIHVVGDLRKFIVAITDSMQSLGWTVLLLLLITYIFAVYLTQLVTDYKVWNSEKVRLEQHLLQEYYGSLDRSMLALYETISDGIHWHEVMDPLKDITPWLSVLFAVYISGIVFALMNVVTGIFVDSAIRAAENDKKRDLVDSMRQLFEGADEDGNGTLTFEEFEGQLGNRFMQAYLQAIDLDEEEAVMLFQLLDIDESGEIEADDFVSGCIKLHGGAKAIDLAAFVHEYRRTAKQWNAHFDLVERSLSWLCEQHSKNAARRL